MNTLFPYIRTKNWQLSTVGVGYIAEGLADIRQCLDILLRTQKGSVPLYPQFGCDIFQYADKPLNFAIPNIKRAIIEAIEVWEKRVVLKKIEHFISIDTPGKVEFTVTVALANEELIDLILYYFGGGFVVYDVVDTGSLTLHALFPPNPDGKRYGIQFTGNGNNVLPPAPEFGFLTIADLYTWVVNNWGGYGRWQLGSDRITCFVNPGQFQTGTLTMSLLATKRFEAVVPKPPVGRGYRVTFVPDDDVPIIAPPDFDTVGDMLSWLQSTYGFYGEWVIEANTYGMGDFYIEDFDSSDFDTGADADYILVLFSNTVNTCVLQVNIT